MPNGSINLGGMLLSCLPSPNVLCDPATLSNPQVAMGSYRQNHSQLQPNMPAGGITSDPNDPSWNWAYFDSSLAQARALKRKAFFRVLFQGGNSPNWVSTNAQQFVPNNNPPLNIWWDPFFQSAVAAVIQAMGARYASSGLIVAVSFNIVTTTSGDWSFPHASVPWVTSASFNVPAVGGTVNVPTGGVSAGMSKNQYCYVPGGGWFYATGASGAAHTTLLNPGTSGNAAPGTSVPSGVTVQVNDTLTLETIYNYTTAKLVGAVNAVASVAGAAFPGALNDQEVGRNGSTDPYPPPTVPPTGPVQQSVVGAGGANPYTGTFANPVTAGDTLVAAFTWNGGGDSVTSFTDSLNNAQWTRIGIVQAQNRSLVLYQYKNTLGGPCTVSVTLTAAYGTVRFAFFELPGASVNAETPASANGAATTLVTTPSITPLHSTDLVLALLVGGNPITQAGSGWTGFQTLNSLASQYVMPGSTQPIAASFSQASAAYVTLIVAFNNLAPGPGPSYQYNAATQIAQNGYANVPGFAIGKNTLQVGNPPPATALAQADNSDIYLPAQTIAGSANTSGTTGVIPAKSALFLQSLWVAYDETGAYSPTSTTPANGNFPPYCQNGGVPYNNPVPVLQATLNLMMVYGAKIVEIYQDDLKYCLPVLQWGAFPVWIPLEDGPQLFTPPYAGQTQPLLPPSNIDMECGPFVVPPYPAPPPPTTDPCVPPPVYMTDIFSAQQTWPL